MIEKLVKKMEQYKRLADIAFSNSVGGFLAMIYFSFLQKSIGAFVASMVYSYLWSGFWFIYIRPRWKKAIKQSKELLNQ